MSVTPYFDEVQQIVCRSIFSWRIHEVCSQETRWTSWGIIRRGAEAWASPRTTKETRRIIVTKADRRRDRHRIIGGIIRNPVSITSKLLKSYACQIKLTLWQRFSDVVHLCVRLNRFFFLQTGCVLSSY